MEQKTQDKDPSLVGLLVPEKRRKTLEYEDYFYDFDSNGNAVESNSLTANSPRRILSHDGIITRMITRTRLRGDYKYYEPHASSAVKPSTVPFTEIKLGVWLEDNLGVIAQVINVTGMRPNRVKIFTCFGMDMVSTSLNGKHSLLFERERGKLYAFDGKRKNFLTEKDKRIIAFIIGGFDIYTAYERATGEKIDTPSKKYAANGKLRRIFNTKDIGFYIRMAIRDELYKNKITAETWIKKLVDSVPGNITTPVHMAIWNTLGKFVPEVRDILAGKDPEDAGERVRTLGSPIPAVYANLVQCPVCGGTKKRILEVNPGDWQSVDCDNCDGRGEVSEQPTQTGQVTTELPSPPSSSPDQNMSFMNERNSKLQL